jgi:hypothetical protein
VTIAPDDLKAVQLYVHNVTGQDWNSLGIIHTQPQGGGYHEGQDLLAVANRAPGPSYANSDYSYADARAVSSNGVGRDLANGTTLAGVPNAGSAFDLGHGFNNPLGFNRWIVGKCQGHDPRTRDIREVIYTLDGRTVHRWDATGRQDDWGDSTHLSHTHFSFFRDSHGRRDKDDNFMGLLKEWFQGITSTQPPSGSKEDEEEIMTRDIPLTSFDSVCIPPVLDGINPRPAYFNVQNDTNGGTYRLRVWVCNTSGQWAPLGDEVIAGNGGYVTLGNGQRKSFSIGKGVSCLHVSRVAGSDGSVYTGPLTWALEVGPRV